jgi:hypothetical protein
LNADHSDLAQDADAGKAIAVDEAFRKYPRNRFWIPYLDTPMLSLDTQSPLRYDAKPPDFEDV